MKKQIARSRHTLELKKEVLLRLSPAQLQEVAGGSYSFKIACKTTTMNDDSGG